MKMVYLAHGWMLGLHGRPLLLEQVVAWRYGPVISSLYNAIRHHKDKPVTNPIKKGLKKGAETVEFTNIETDLLEQIYGLYGDWDGMSLSNLTHKKDSPWDVVWKKSGKNSVIPDDMIEMYYRGLYEDYLTTVETTAANGRY